ncbi:hypothetical protein Ava_0534 [Trichormus variabilis ATCC 29413]|uniref:Uncharacterized protein n=2 Tax=Anabaena variabilis TaxID=264691 RepID=Q3MFS8_TRIV2|nr:MULTISPECIES: hypothetical protein [Nostocaceae]ABA20158.1 hypothetical protein Ava_0534 [Trichormus variabilis ATCC 29413]MBC1216821.1 hypothetical protein [Trichormus variabilis ARAD]MBC1256240.1 hypothetical protein [Trichormus variabilis V5]MBC1269611.1 hypothetical protein [Trichormus variabilis FSR]MBC1305009.1 hypothetical protein [Trichormus variabilis N2B]
MKNINSVQKPLGETTDVEVWLSRAGLKFADLGHDDASKAIRKQWREYQAAVQKCCVTLHQPPECVQLSGDYAKLRIPGNKLIANDESVLNS